MGLKRGFIICSLYEDFYSTTSFLMQPPFLMISEAVLECFKKEGFFCQIRDNPIFVCGLVHNVIVAVMK